MTVKENMAKLTAAPASQSYAIPDRNTLIAFFTFVIIAGGAAVAVRIAYTEMAPYALGAARFGVAAVIFWILTLARKVEIPRGRALSGAVIYGALSVGLAYVFMSWGLVKMTASLFQVIMALVPLATILFAALHRLEKLQLRILLGALLAVAGISVAVNGYQAAEVSIPHLLAVIAGVLCLAESSVVAKMIPRSHPLATNAIAITVGALILAAGSILRGEVWVIPTLPSTWLAFLYLTVGVSVIVFMLFLWVLKRWTASGTSFSFVLMPLVTMLAASWLGGEQITWNLAAGAALVICGVLVGALLQPKKKDKPQHEYDCKPC